MTGTGVDRGHLPMIPALRTAVGLRRRGEVGTPPTRVPGGRRQPWQRPRSPEQRSLQQKNSSIFILVWPTC